MKKVKYKKCRECKKDFIPYNSSTQVVCNMGCALEYNRKQNQKKEAIEWKEQRKKIVDKLKTLSEYEKEAKIEVQKYKRLLGMKDGCMSCGTKQSMEWHGSHYFPAGQFSGMIFDEDNIWCCCKQCNVWKGGNLIGFRKGLVKRFGELWVQILEERGYSSRNKKWTREELIEIKNKYQKLNSELLKYDG